MKKITIIFLLFFLLIPLINNKVKASSIKIEQNDSLEPESFIDTKPSWKVKEETISLNGIISSLNEYQIDKAYLVNEVDNLIILVNDIYVKILYEQSIIFNFIGEYHQYYYQKDNNTLYIITNQDIYVINIDTLETDKINPFLDEIWDMVYINKQYYFIGQYQNNARIILYNSLFEIIKYQDFGGLGNEIFTLLLYNDNNLIVGGIKDAISENSTLANCGNINEEKAFILMLDLDFNLLNETYFNELSSSEVLKSINKVNNQYHIILETLDKLYQYKLNSDFIMEESISYPLNKQNENIYEVISDLQIAHPYYIYIQSNNNDNLNYLKVFDKNKIIDEYQLLQSGIILDYYVKDGILYLLINDEQNLYLTVLSEYKINSISELTLTRFNMNLTNFDHLQIESYLEPLSFNLIATNPNITSKTPGKYEATYVAKRINCEDITINTIITISNYINIIDQGIYPVGYTLSFLGDAYVNDEIIYNGTVLKTPGEWLIKVYDNQKRVSEYHITVIDNYYKTNYNQIIENYYEVKLDTVSSWDITCEAVKTLDELYINDQIYDLYVINNQTLTINFPHESLETKHYHLNYFTYWDHLVLKRFYLNEDIGLIVKKKTPSIDIQEEIILDTIECKMIVNDLYQASNAINIKLWRYNNDWELLTNVNYYFNNIEPLLPKLQKKEKYKITISYLYEEGTKDNYETNLINYEFITKKNIDEYLNITNKFDQQTISQINLNLSLKDLTIKNCEIVNNNITNELNNEINYLWLYISLIITLIIICLSVVIWLYRKKKYR